jgi:exodeoxyribonuclease VII small subunit
MSETFKESYGVLQKHAQTLRKQSDPNIDDLLRVVEESVAAYKVCQARIDAVEQALEKALGSAKEPAAATTSGSTAAGGSSDSDDDIPF